MASCGDHNKASGGRGAGSGVPNLHNVRQKVLKMEQKGGTPYFDHFWGRFHPLGTPTLAELLDSENCTAFPFYGAIFRTSSRNFEVGVLGR